MGLTTDTSHCVLQQFFKELVLILCIKYNYIMTSIIGVKKLQLEQLQ